MKRLLVLAGVLVAFPGGLLAAQPTYESLWRDASRDPACAPQDYPNYKLLVCKAKRTGWYFTKPNHPGHPGVIKREIVRQPDGVWVAAEEGSFFGTAAAHPAFLAWLMEIAAEDRKLKEEVEKREKQM